MRPGVRLAFDVGTARIGVARSDATGTLAVPLPAVAAGDGALAEASVIAREYEALEAYVGLPLHLSGEEGASATLARQWAGALQQACGLPVRMIDERLSTVQAQRGLLAGGRSTRESRALIDSASAVIVLQAALDAEARSGAVPGTPVDAGNVDMAGVDDGEEGDA